MVLGGICVCCTWGAGCKGSGGEQAGTISGDKTAETGFGEEASKDSADGELESETAADESKDDDASDGEETGMEPLADEDGEYIFPESHVRLLTREELKSPSPDDLRIARNEIYARHGRRFTSSDLQEYFEARDWYEGTVEPDQFSEEVLNDFEKENVKLIKAREDLGSILDTAEIYSQIMERHGLFGWNGLLEYGRIDAAISDSYKEWYPELVDMGDYYEAKGQVLSVPVYYPWDAIEKVKPGDKMTLSFGLIPDQKEYTVTEILQEHGKDAKVISVSAPGLSGEFQLVFTDVFDNGKYALAIVDWIEGDDYVIWNSDDISCACEIVYQGSFYLAKDCVIDVAGEERSVKDQWEPASERNPFGGAIFGDILEVDENGLITRIRQQVAG